MNFTRKPQQRFGTKGMDVGTPIDQIAPDKWSYLKNIRVNSDGQLTTRPGLADDTGAAQPIYTFPGASYLHSLARMVDSSPETSWGWARFVGDDLGNLYVGQGSQVVANAYFDAAWNPVMGVSKGDPFSGNPLSMIPFRPEGGSSSALYIGDSLRMAEIVFRPQDDFTTGPKVYGIGLAPPNGQGGGALPIPAAGAAGNLNGTYWWSFRFRNIYTGKKSNPSATTRQDITPDPIYGAEGLATGLALTNQSATMTLPDLIAGSAPAEDDVQVDVFRFGGTVFAWHYVGSGSPGAAFKDDLLDIQILSAEQPPVDATGQPALIQPFPTLDISRNGTLQFSQPGGAGTPVYITASSLFPAPADPIGVWNSYMPGTSVIIDGNYAVTFYRFGSSAVAMEAEIREDLPGGLSLGVNYTYSIASPIRAGVPLQHLWGPMGQGQFGLTMFGCGDPRQAGTLYWTNGNDPDSSAIVNSLEVTSPDEPLVNGIVWSDGRNYVWSTRRAFEIVPDFSNPGQFLARQIPHMGGLLAPWGVCDCGAFIAYVGYDGIYGTQGVGSESLTDDDLYPWFPHDANPGFPFSRGGDTVQNPDQNQLQKWRLSWQDGILYFDWPPATA